MSTMRSILIIIASLATGLIACGEDTNSPAGPADLSQWCDFERPRQNCTLEEGFIVHDIADIQVICNSPCNELQQVVFEGEGGRALAGLHGWKKVGYLSINTNEQGPENLVGLESLEMVDWLEISNTRSLKNLKGLNNVRHLGGQVNDPEIPSGLFIKDSSVTSLEGLDSLETIRTLEISHAPINSLMPLENVEIIDFLGVRSTSVKSIEGIIISSPDFRAVNISQNEELTSIPALDLVRAVTGGVTFEYNAKLSACEIDAFVDNLETRPEDRWIRVTGNKPCP